jgi:hypothetical protein
MAIHFLLGFLWFLRVDTEGVGSFLLAGTVVATVVLAGGSGSTVGDSSSLLITTVAIVVTGIAGDIGSAAVVATTAGTRVDLSVCTMR